MIFPMAGFAGLLMTLGASPALAVCLPEPNGAGRLLVADVSDCGSPIGGSFCASELRRLEAAEVGCGDNGPLPVTMMSYAGHAASRSDEDQTSQETSPFEDVLLAGALGDQSAERPSASTRLGSVLDLAVAGLDPESVAVLLAGLGLAAGQMRRRAGLRVVSS